MFCPHCSSEFRDHTLRDSHLKGYVCANGVVFYTTLIERREPFYLRRGVGSADEMPRRGVRLHPQYPAARRCTKTRNLGAVKFTLFAPEKRGPERSSRPCRALQ
jgi:hypothetical protein